MTENEIIERFGELIEQLNQLSCEAYSYGCALEIDSTDIYEERPCPMRRFTGQMSKTIAVPNSPEGTLGHQKVSF